MQQVEQLAKPLRQVQIEAARRFWLEGGWESKEFGMLKEAFPTPRDAVSIKAIVVNVLYGTNIIAIVKVANCVDQFLKTDYPTGPAFVEHLVDAIARETKRRHYSFASKYAHFFVDPSLPILDGYAEWMLERHLGKTPSSSAKRYEKFVEDIEALKRGAGLDCDCTDLDKYLWIAGEYWYWTTRPAAYISSDLKRAFESLTEDYANEPTLALLLGLDTGKTTINEAI